MTERIGMGIRRFGRVNWRGLGTLVGREIRRFVAVYIQTLLAPLATAVLFMTVFTLAFGADRGAVMGMPFEVFLAPGVLMMAVIQNAFANTSSSLMIAKEQGNIVDTLMAPLSPGEILAGYVAGGMARGALCAVAVGVVVFPAVGTGLAHPLWAFAFVGMGCLMLSLIGLLAAIYAAKFDQMAAITNFIITPLSFLSGTFYSIERLPPLFQTLSHANPFFYLIDGFRYGALGVSDSSPWLGLAVVATLNAALWGLAWRWLTSGYRLKS
ncbi:MAG: ABC transporter permease [Pseudomonadota bacterium]